jgi:signal transduction histidine kinase
MTHLDHPSIDDLNSINVFADLEPSQLEWLRDHFSNEQFEPGEILIQPGTPADYMVAIFEGEIQARRDGNGQDMPIYIAPKGRVTGKLPFSRMKEFMAVVRAVGRTRLGRLHESLFPEMLHVIPGMGERMVGVLSDRIRETARTDQNHEKLAALGKLSAGLAHELNNPASAAQRSASNLREALKQLADANMKLATCQISDQQRANLTAFEEGAANRIDSNPILDSLAQSDREDELINWFTDHGIKSGWEIAPALVETGMDIECMDELVEILGSHALGTAVQHAAATFNAERLLREIENSTNRISVLVRAIKEYSYMDRMKEQEIDIHRGIDNTLTMLDHCLKHGVKVKREYDTSLPKIMANGGELNQVWTNLIDNAIDAMQDGGILRIRTTRENDYVLVEITDNGTGIPEDIKARIFEPFFTTKGVGQGTGLGLDMVYRIVGRHHGDVRFTSKPGETRFQVRLPLSQPINRTESHEELHAQESYT